MIILERSRGDTSESLARVMQLVIQSHLLFSWGFPGSSDGKASVCIAGDWDLIPVGRPPGDGDGHQLQYSYLDREAWQATVHAVTKSQTRLSD